MKYIQKILANEEALHLILAALIGVLGGIVNLLFLYFVEISQWFIFQKPLIFLTGFFNFG